MSFPMQVTSSSYAYNKMVLYKSHKNSDDSQVFFRDQKPSKTAAIGSSSRREESEGRECFFRNAMFVRFPESFR